MSDLRSSAANRALATALRRRREQKRMSGDEVASALGWSASKVSRIETNRIGIKPRDLTRLLDLYDADGTQRGQLIALSAEPERSGWWHGYADAIDAEYASYISLEASAAHLRCWSPGPIHGLLQTQDYADAIMEILLASYPLMPPTAIRRRVEVRMRRQELLTGPAGQRFTFVLDEAVLHHRYGSAEVMHNQLLRLNEVSLSPDVTIRVLAFAGRHPVVSPGAFALLEFAPVHGTAIGDVVYMEHLTGHSFVDDDTETHQYRQAFEQLNRESLDEEASRQLIAQIAAEEWA